MKGPPGSLKSYYRADVSDETPKEAVALLFNPPLQRLEALRRTDMAKMKMTREDALR
ncbi:MAG: flagellin-specific chaperone FliS, partial [Yoonia sp.]